MKDTNYMEMLVKYEVRYDVLGDFLIEVTNRNITITVSGTNCRGDHLVFCPYDASKEEHYRELNSHLQDLIFEEDSDYWVSLDRD